MMKGPHAASAIVSVGEKLMRRFIDVQVPSDRAVLAARAIEKMAGWRAEARSELVPPTLPCLGYEPHVDALLFPAGSIVPVTAIEAAVRDLRCDALAVVAEDEPGSPVRAHAVLRSSGAHEWHGPCRLWCSPEGGIWLVGGHDVGSRAIAIPLANTRLRVAAPPWRSAAEEQLGLGLGCALLNRAMESLR